VVIGVVAATHHTLKPILPVVDVLVR